MTTISGTVSLTPLGSVDTSSSTSGHSMFTLLLPDTTAIGNVIQYEYSVTKTDPLSPTQSGFLPLENSISQSGIQNQIIISVPSANNSYDDDSFVKVRAYIGNTDTVTPVIQVTNWSNTCPLSNPPVKPTGVEAYLLRGDPVQNVDRLYVQTIQNASYVNGEISFVVSYSYKNDSGTNTWVVSPLISNWTTHNGNILLPEIVLDADVSYNSIGADAVVYTAINAVYNYTFDNNTYYSVSEISTTVESEIADYYPPTLNDIVPSSDYSVYADNAQTVTLQWSAPTSSDVPKFVVDSYTIIITKDGVFQDSLTNLPESVYTKDVDISQFVDPETSNSFGFKISATFADGTIKTSEEKYLNSYIYSSDVQNLIVAWANNAGDNTQTDILLTFDKPSSLGSFDANVGMPKIFIEVLDDIGAIKNTREIIVTDPDQTTYTQYLADINTTNVGKVRVYVETPDTNSANYLAGPESEVTYVTSELAVITHPAQGVVNVVSNDLLGRYASIHWHASGLNSFRVETTPAIYSGYEVTQNTQAGKDELFYTFVFEPQFIASIGVSPGKEMYFTVGNGSGVSEGSFYA